MDVVQHPGRGDAVQPSLWHRVQWSLLEYWRGSDYHYPTRSDGICFKYKVGLCLTSHSKALPASRSDREDRMRVRVHLVVQHLTNWGVVTLHAGRDRPF